MAVYRVPYMEEELRQQLREAYFPSNAHAEMDGSIAAYIERCIPLALFDVVIANADARFNVSDFAQPMEGLDSPQVAYEEALLSESGQVLDKGVGCADHVRSGRIAFYLHYFDPSKPLRWTYGPVFCPPVEIVPESLWKALPYEPVDEDDGDEVSPE